MRTYLLYIFFTIVSLNVSAQKPIVLLEVDPKEAEVGEMLTITIKSNVQGEVDIDFPSGFVHGYNIMNGMEQEVDYNTGKVINYYYLSQTGAMPKAGTFKIGPAYIKKGNKVYRSNTVSITINTENVSSSSSDELTSKQLRQPAFGVIEKSKSVIYEGEPLIINAKVYSKFNATQLENYQTYSMDGVLDKHEIGNVSRITVEEEKIKKTTYFTFVYDKKVFFPIGTGTMTIDPFKLILRRGFESLPITSNSTTVEVKPLPGNVPKNFIGAVGQFSVSRELRSDSLKQGDVFTMLVEISGFGNLQNIFEPKLNLPRGFLIYGDPIIKEDFTYGSRGAEGKITYEYNIQVTNYGKLTVPETSISYFDPIKEKYIQNKTGSDILFVEQNKQFKAPIIDSTNQRNASSEIEISSLRRDEGNKLPETILYKTPVFWIGLTTPVFFAFLLGIWWNKKDKEIVQIEKKQVKQRSILGIQQLFEEAENALKQEDWSNYYYFIEKGLQRSMSLYLKNDDSLVISKSEIFQLLKEQNVEDSKIEALRNLFTTCEQARYGLGQSNDDREKMIAAAKTVTKSILEA